ncbi:MAG TPA: hypothetical protein VHL32_07770 [Gemmatimonadaceae bacterium]|jgi:hypothetical protein|nr:hypothetical protein [Gemmatimonadaceae bacterium]
MLEFLKSLFGSRDMAQVSHHVVAGIPVLVNNTRPDIDTAVVIARLTRCLALIEQYVPWHFRHLRRDFAGIVVQRFACRGAYFHEQRACLVELTFTVNPQFSDAEVAATILHEAMHARLHTLGFPLEMEDRARQERFCRRAEIEFGQVVPNGEAVVERARWTADLSDEEVAPEIDPLLAARRIAEVDRAALEGRG